ncbi:MAG TPA: TolC family protein [Dokdonella sp.]|nr:TolC family protein [Dokdonella sp.]
MDNVFLRLPMAVLMTLLASCASVSRREGAEQVQTLLGARVADARVWNRDATGADVDARVGQLVAAPLTPASAQQVALLKNPRIAAEYARLGIAQADVVEASRIGNPGFSGSAIKGGGASIITTGLSLPLADLLLLSSKRRFAEGEYVRAQHLIAAELVSLAADVNQAWYEAAGAQQVAAMRDPVSRAASASADLAQRFYEAGNISALEFRLEQASASQARIAATMARAESTRARLALNTRMGLSGEMAAHWQLDVPLAAPVVNEDALETLQSLARENRLDLLAARREVDLLGDALGIAKRWRLIGNIDIGVERERETDGNKLTGPTLSLAIPLFNQGQAAIARAEANQEITRADLARLELQIDNDVRLGRERVAAMRAIAEDYRANLVPQREAIVRHQSERNNYMLIGAFELLLSKQQEFDAYEGYLDAVRDYWLARNDLARAIGTALPSDVSINARVIGVDALLAPPEDAGMGHMHHGGAMGDMPGMDHSGHAMSGAESGQDKAPSPPVGNAEHMDHSGHDMSATKSTPPTTEKEKKHPGEVDHSGHEMPNNDSVPSPVPVQSESNRSGEHP